MLAIIIVVSHSQSALLYETILSLLLHRDLINHFFTDLLYSLWICLSQNPSQEGNAM